MSGDLQALLKDDRKTLLFRSAKGRSGVLSGSAMSQADVYDVALDYEFSAGACGLTHVSLKVYTGPSPLASALRFRAEWDPRAEARLHVQPHWNIDHVGGGDGAGAYAQETGSAAPWVPVPKSAPWAQAQDSTPESTVLNLRKVHFAMGSSWHLPVTGDDHRHSAPFADEAALVRWVSVCAAYIRVQLAHA